MPITISARRRSAIFEAIDRIVSEFYLQTLVPAPPETQFVHVAKVRLYWAVLAAAEGRKQP